MEVSKKGPKEVVASVSTQASGVVGAKGQVSSLAMKRKVNVQEGKGDSLYVMMQRAKVGDPFVRDIKTSPDPAIVLANEVQLNDLVRFCAAPVGLEIAMLIVDPTFCLGDFELTPITYRHLLLET